MAGSYNHIINKRTGGLLKPEKMEGMIENLGDAYEAIEECFWMIQVLADGDKKTIHEAMKSAQEFIAINHAPQSRKHGFGE